MFQGSGQYGFSHPDSMVSYTKCPPGTETDPENSNICRACAPGWFSSVAGTQCLPCLENTYAPYGNASTCMACPMSATSLKAATDCMCAVGMFFKFVYDIKIDGLCVYITIYVKL